MPQRRPQGRVPRLDLETTGIAPEHKIVEIAAVDIVENDLVIVGSDLVRPSVPIPPEASAVHHILNECLRQGVSAPRASQARFPRRAERVDMNPVLLLRVTFGKHRGSEWKDVPRDYSTG
jgi:DNA polymerase III epsilon subunit-like protein